MILANIRSAERAVLVVPRAHRSEDAERRRDEFTELALSAGAEVLAQVSAHVQVPNPRFYLGTGKVEEVAEVVTATGADLVLVDHALSPVQERNLERRLGVRVIDRAELILDIFSQRARSYEGKLEVELAQLRHLATRLVRGWTHLERQRGGSIGLRGPGETQLETDRRLLGARVRQLVKRLDKVQRQRTQQRRARLRHDLPRVAFVGYTNAGKSTLFNALADADVYVADQLFATLDPTVRRLEGLGCGTVVVADTVGFVRELPHDLVAAFRATLAEARDADLLVHVSDAADSERDLLAGVVEQVLADIGAGDVPRLRVFNKIDLIDVVPHLDRDAAGRPSAVWLSAATGAGIDVLRQALDERLAGDRVRGEMQLPLDAGRLHAQLAAAGVIVSEQVTADGWHMTLDVPLALVSALPAEVQRILHGVAAPEVVAAAGAMDESDRIATLRES